MRHFLLVVAAVAGAFALAWLFGAGHVGEIHPDYGLALAWGDEILPPAPGPFAPVYERVSGVSAALAALVSLAALAMAEAFWPEGNPMAIRGWQGRVRRWMRTHRRSTYGAQFCPETLREILVDTAVEKPRSSCTILYLAPPPEYLRRPME